MKANDPEQRCSEDRKKHHGKDLAQKFSNLYMDTIIYKERSISVVKLSDINVDERGIEAHAKKIAVLLDRGFVPDEWHFGAPWDISFVADNWIYVPYVSFALMSDPDLIRRVLECVEKNDREEALRQVIMHECGQPVKS